MQLKLQSMLQEPSNGSSEAPQIRFIGRYNHKIVTVTKIIPDAERLFHKPIQLMQIDIGKQLARDIAEWNAFANFSMMAQNNHAHQLQNSFIINLSRNKMKQYFMVNGSKIFTHITFKRIDLLGIVAASLSQKGL